MGVRTAANIHGVTDSWGEKIHNPQPLPVTHRLGVLECFRGLWILKDHPLARGRSQILITCFLDAVGRTPWAPDLENQNRDLGLMRTKPQECSSSSCSRNQLDKHGQELQSPRGVAPHVCTLFLSDVFILFYCIFFWRKAECKIVDLDEEN